MRVTREIRNEIVVLKKRDNREKGGEERRYGITDCGCIKEGQLKNMHEGV